MNKQTIAGYFSFSKKERRGIITLLVLITLLAFAPFLFPLFIKTKRPDAGKFKEEIAALRSQPADSSTGFSYKDNEEDNAYYQPYEKKRYAARGELFYFDPNTITAAEWKRLGVRDKTIATIQNYIAKGGRFRQPEDLGKIWGFFPDEVERLTPYVQVQQQSFASTNAPERPVYDKPKYVATPVDINTADTAAFIALPGIGSKLSQRIIAFRDKLGGFYKTEQVAETFGLPDSTFQKIRPRLVINNHTVKQLNINTATIDELKTHPYIRWNLANAIVQYRTQHGRFTSVNDLKKIMAIDDALFNKIAPYVKVEG